MQNNIQELKMKLVKACRILYMEGITGNMMYGHISARIPNTDRFLIPGHFHVNGKHLGETALEDIITLDLKGKKLEGELPPLDEIRHYIAIYNLRSDVNSIAHVHPTLTTAFGVAGKDILPVWQYGTPFAKGIAVYETPPDRVHGILSEEAGMAIAEKLGDKKALIHRGHVVVVVGETIEEACVNSILLEETAKVQLAACLLGGEQFYFKKEATPMFKRNIDEFWRYFDRKLSYSKYALK